MVIIQGKMANSDHPFPIPSLVPMASDFPLHLVKATIVPQTKANLGQMVKGSSSLVFLKHLKYGTFVEVCSLLFLMGSGILKACTPWPVV